jgi:hypothetical protein
MAVTSDDAWMQAVIIPYDLENVKFFIIPQVKETEEVYSYLQGHPDARLLVKSDPSSVERTAIAWFESMSNKSEETGFYVDGLTKTIVARGQNAHLCFTARKFKGICVFYDYE